MLLCGMVRKNPLLATSARSGAPPSVSLAGELAKQVHFGLAIGSAVGPKHFVKPNRGLALHVGMLPGFPGIIGLGFARDESPIYCTDVFLFRDGEDSVERAAH